MKEKKTTNDNKTETKFEKKITTREKKQKQKKMHTFSENSSGVPAFLAKLWRLVEDEETNNLIYWSAVSNIYMNKFYFKASIIITYFYIETNHKNPGH